MKRFLGVLISILLSVAAVPASFVTVSAESYGYARSNSRTSFLYRYKNESEPVFAVPYGYCIEILRSEGDWYYAKYASDSGIYREKTGYCRREQFSSVEGVPSVTFLYKTVPVKYTPDTVFDLLPSLSEITIEAAYYGALTVGTTNYAYVYCQGAFGYIEGTFEEESAETFKPTGGNENNQTDSGWSAGLVSVIVILAMLVAVILVLHFVTAKSKRKVE